MKRGKKAQKQQRKYLNTTISRKNNTFLGVY